MSMLGIIGGSGLYDLPGLEDVVETTYDTPWGAPSSPIITGTLGPTKIAFLSRHGRGHRLSPTEIPFRANIAALHQAGVTHVVSLSAVGSLKEELPPRTAVIPDQIIDLTRLRERTFFEHGIVAHVGIADPFSNVLREAIRPLAEAVAPKTQVGGTYICIEGPQFSTRAESHLFRSWGADIIGMTAMPEARLAREAGLAYATIAMVTDFDVWHQDAEDVSVDVVERVMADNIAVGKAILTALAQAGLPPVEPEIRDALAGAIITRNEAISEEGRATLAFFAPRPAED